MLPLVILCEIGILVARRIEARRPDPALESHQAFLETVIATFSAGQAA